MTAREKVEAVLALIDAGKVTRYHVAKQANISIATLDKLFSGDRKVENIRLETAERLGQYFDEEGETLCNSEK